MCSVVPCDYWAGQTASMATLSHHTTTEEEEMLRASQAASPGCVKWNERLDDILCDSFYVFWGYTDQVNSMNDNE